LIDWCIDVRCTAISARRKFEKSWWADNSKNPEHLVGLDDILWFEVANKFLENIFENGPQLVKIIS
jgi:hypothetical protein